MKRLLTLVLIGCLMCNIFFVAFCASAADRWDVNQDGSKNMKDVLALRKFIAGLDTSSIQEKNGDVNLDGKTDMKDVLFLRKYLIGLVTEDGVEITTTTRKPTTTTAAPVKATEMRAVWLAYYEVADLMKSSADATKKAIDSAMKACAFYGANAVIFHVRAYSDAYYKSSVFPTHKSVTALVKAGFDPLTYAVSSAHAQGLELHAWINPYRVGTTLDNARCSDTFLFNSRYYYSPASANARSLIVKGIQELVKNYKIDGIHLDDYFYPEGLPTTKQSYDIGYTSGSVANFRRTQVNLLVKTAYKAAHDINPNISFGISPGGTIAKDRDNMYADVETWLSTAGYVDYLCPQIYFGFKNGSAPFKDRTAQWATLPRAKGVKLYIGMAPYKAGLLEDTWAGAGKTEWAGGGDILARQVQYLRTRSDVNGFMLFSYRYMNKSAFTTSEYNLSIASKEIDALITEIKKH